MQLKCIYLSTTVVLALSFVACNSAETKKDNPPTEASSSKTETTPASSTSAANLETVSSDVLKSQCKEDITKWQGKEVIVKGKVIANISNNGIVLKMSLANAAASKYAEALCEFKQENGIKNSDYPKGKEVLVKGTVTGYEFGEVELNNCQIVQ